MVFFYKLPKSAELTHALPTLFLPVEKHGMGHPHLTTYFIHTGTCPGCLSAKEIYISVNSDLFTGY